MWSYLRGLARAWPSRHPATIYMFHSIASPPEDGEGHTPEVFESFLAWLVQRTKVVPLTHLAKQIQHGSPSQAMAALTFDDGYRDNYTHAYPLLRKYQCPATFFITTGWTGRENMMSPAMLRELAVNGYGIGSHTVSHPHLSVLSADRARQELQASRAMLTEITAVECQEFCYPYGDFSPAVKQLVKEAGYRCATAVSQTVRQHDPFELPRTVIPTVVSYRRFALTLYAPAAWQLLRRMDRDYPKA